MARPPVGSCLVEEIDHWSRAGIEIVVSLLEREEVEDLELGSVPSLCGKHGIQFVSFPIPDQGIPVDTDYAMRFAAGIVSTGRNTAIHCQEGIGRSSLIAAGILVCRGFEPSAAISAIEKARKLPIPDTDEQREWVMNLKRN